MLNKFVLLGIDDILIISQNFAEYLQHIHNLYLLSSIDSPIQFIIEVNVLDSMWSYAFPVLFRGSEVTSVCLFLSLTDT